MHGPRRMARGVIALLMVPALELAAQTAVLSGAVVRDTLGHGLAEATVTIPELHRTATTDAKGEFTLSGVTPGRHAVEIRHAGFSALVDTVVFVVGQNADREYVLDPTPTFLDSVRTDAARGPVDLGAQMDRFRERLHRGVGVFITEPELRKSDSLAFFDMLEARIAGLHTFRPYPRDRPAVNYLTSGPNACIGDSVAGCVGSPCPMTLYVNGALYYADEANRDSTLDRFPIPDISRIATRDVEAVEYYGRDEQVPDEFKTVSTGCAVLVLWMKDR